MEKLIQRLRADYPDVTFSAGSQLCWSPESREVHYGAQGSPADMHGVLHEIGHARLGHSTYSSDADLLIKETLAWEEAVQIAGRYGLSINAEHIQDCVDTYRDWLHKRSLCPICKMNGFQQPGSWDYCCINCGHKWRVTAARFCRPYRLSKQK